MCCGGDMYQNQLLHPYGFDTKSGFSPDRWSASLLSSWIKASSGVYLISEVEMLTLLLLSCENLSPSMSGIMQVSQNRRTFSAGTTIPASFAHSHTSAKVNLHMWIASVNPEWPCVSIWFSKLEGPPVTKENVHIKVAFQYQPLICKLIRFRDAILNSQIVRTQAY